VSSRLDRHRTLLALLAVLAAIAVLSPPVAMQAQRYVFAQALQFGVLAFVVPALLVLGAPWRHARWVRRRVWPAWAALVGFLLVAAAWRLPVMVDALARHWALTIAEAVTLVGAGCALWLELVASPPLTPRVSRPQRALFAAVAMWSVWAIGYILGFSGTAWFASYARPAGHGLSIMVDQQIAAALLWAVPGVVCVPLVYVCLMSWLRDSADPDGELGAVRSDPRASGQAALRPPRGWRLPSA
jgi:cytochrome c oxidase assembly factor CtaG